MKWKQDLYAAVLLFFITSNDSKQTAATNKRCELEHGTILSFRSDHFNTFNHGLALMVLTMKARAPKRKEKKWFVKLQKDVPHLGHSGEIAEVKVAYAFKYLIPRQFATKATEEEVTGYSTLVAQKKLALEQRREDSRKVSDSLAMTTLVFTRTPIKEDTNGTRFYGSLTVPDVINQLALKGIQVKADRLNMTAINLIKTFGSTKVGVQLPENINAAVKVRVVRANVTTTNGEE